MIYTQEQIAERGYVYAMPPPPRYPRPQQRARSPGASASGAGPSTAVVAAAANATPPATVPPTGPRTARQLLQLQREQHLTDDELLSVMIDSMEDGGFSGMLGNDQKAAILALRGGKVLNERERTSTYFAADDRMLAINIKLDEMDLKLANVSFFFFFDVRPLSTHLPLFSLLTSKHPPTTNPPSNKTPTK
jgi:hypothetical protein